MQVPSLKDLPAPPPGKHGWPWTKGPARLSSGQLAHAVLPVISVVTPSYNQGRYIEETIRSVLLQGYPHLEYIIMDAGSTDGSVEIIQKYAPWLTFWYSGPDQGQSDAINKGWKRTTGNILAWLNSDDVYEMDTLAQVAAFFKEHPQTQMAYGNCRIIDGTSAITGRAPTRDFNLRKLVCNTWFISQPSTFFRREAIDRVGNLNEQLFLIMDWDLYLRIALNSLDIRHIPHDLSRCRIGEHTKTSSLPVRSGEEKIRVLKRIYANKEYDSLIRSFRHDAFGYVYQWSGRASYRDFQNVKAFILLLKAVKHCPSYLADKRTMKMLIYSITGLNWVFKRRKPA
jgi:GT2 family glycosyltransferase